MKSLGLIAFLLLFIMGCDSSDTGQTVRHAGPFQAYERQIKFDLEACEKSWQKSLPNLASCELDIDGMPESFVWHAGRIIHHWKYNDQSWLVDISIHHTEKGYRISMYGSQPEPKEYYQFNVAKKYIQSALNDLGKTSVKQIIILPKQKSTASGQVPLGSVEIVQRNISTHNKFILDKCSRTWKDGQCFVDVVNGTYKESLLYAEQVQFKTSNLYLRTSGFLAWYHNSGMSDYKIILGSNDAKLNFSDFRRLWLSNTPDKNIQLQIQKFSFHREQNYYRDEFQSFAKIEKYFFKPVKEICRESFKNLSAFKSHCVFNLPVQSYALSNRDIVNSVMKTNDRYAMVWARAIKRAVIIDINTDENRVSEFEDFWAIIETAFNQKLSRPILLMTTGHQ